MGLQVNPILPPLEVEGVQGCEDGLGGTVTLRDTVIILRSSYVPILPGWGVHLRDTV